MRPLWLIETEAFGSSLELLKTEIRRQGMAYGVIHHDGFVSGYLNRVGNHVLDADDCVIFIGTWPLWRHIQLHRGSWVPGGWCSTDNLDCARYYPHFEPFLLNQNSVILNGTEAIKSREDLFARFARDRQVFVRPSGCLKVFNGRCVDADSFATALAPARYDPATQVVIAEPKRIGREWRFVIAEHRAIAASQYYAEGVKCLRQGCPSHVTAFVENVLAEIAWEPDKVFIMDVCESEDKLYVLELNGFSCAGMYDCDLSSVVEKVSELAERAWNRKHQPA
jgi:hypothetical protein